MARRPDTAQAELVTSAITRDLELAVANFEFPLTVGPDGDSRFAVTGEEFVQCTQFGRYTEGDECGLSPTADGAIEHWSDAARSIFPITDNSVLYWRIRPEIRFVCASRYGPSGWQIYSRFLISDKPRKS